MLVEGESEEKKDNLDKVCASVINIIVTLPPAS